MSTTKNNTIRTIDLFAGIGGIRKGFEATGGFETVYANDFDKHCKLTYDVNFESIPLTVKDIKNVSVQTGEVPEYDFLLAGFPCQPFSIGAHGKGFEDEKGRGTMFEEIERILRETEHKYHGKPMGFFLENVKNLLTHDEKRTFATIYRKLEDLGYYIDYRVYNSLKFGVPQSRERIYIVGFRDKNLLEEFKKRWPNPHPKEHARVKSVLEPSVDSRYYYNGKFLYDKIKDEVTNEDYVYMYRRNFVRAHKGGYSPTLVASMGLGGHNVPIIKDRKGIRRLTPMECARLQGYNDLHIPLGIADQQIYKQIGNSVTVPAIQAIAQSILEAIATVSEPERVENPKKASPLLSVPALHI